MPALGGLFAMGCLPAALIFSVLGLVRHSGWKAALAGTIITALTILSMIGLVIYSVIRG